MKLSYQVKVCAFPSLRGGTAQRWGTLDLAYGLLWNTRFPSGMADREVRAGWIGFVLSHPFAKQRERMGHPAAMMFVVPRSQKRDLGHPGGWFGLVLSHPFANSAKGWGTRQL